MKIGIWFLVLAVGLGSCQQKAQEVEAPKVVDNVPLSECEVPVEAIFQDTVGLVSHSFEAFTDYAMEQAAFPSGLQLALRQSGCLELQQRYVFTLPELVAIHPDSIPGPFWSRQLQGQFEYMSQYNAQFMAYGDMLKVAADFVTLGDTLQIFEDAAMIVDQFETNAQTQLSVTFLIEP